MVPLVSPADGVSEEQFKKRFADRMTARREAGEKLQSVMNDDKQRQEEAHRHNQELYEQRTEFMKQHRTASSGCTC
jgi:hypothetical protein